MKTHPSLQIFRPGQHTAMSGDRLSFAAADLEASAAAYNPALFEAPIVVGHPQTDGPAYGWVKALSFADNALEAEPDQVDPAFAELVAAGRYKKISASFYSPTAPNNPVPGVYYLRHVGFLGAQSPAVKGLRSPQFAEAEAGIVEFVAFSEYDDETNASLWRALREWIIGKFGLADADQIAPQYQVQRLEQGAQDALRATPPTPLFADPTPPETLVTPAEQAALEAENARLKTELSTAHATLAQAHMLKIHADHQAFAETLINDGHLLPGERPVVLAALNHFALQETPLDFSDGDGAAPQPLLAGFRAFLSALPKRLEFGEIATHARKPTADGRVEFAAPAGFTADPSQLLTHRQARAYQAQHNTDYLTALNAVTAP